MKWQIFSIGKPSLNFAKLGIEEYSKRLRRYTKVEFSQNREGGSGKNSRFLLDASEGAFRVALDERGDCLSTLQLVEEVELWQNTGRKKIALLIGGADGHTDELREKVDQVWSLSRFTLQHELAQLVLLEQIYRVHTILKGEPYHRA